jgi:hypothetical protein
MESFEEFTGADRRLHPFCRACENNFQGERKARTTFSKSSHRTRQKIAREIEEIAGVVESSNSDFSTAENE